MQPVAQASVWTPITLDFQGPSRSETPETFTDFRLNVTFTNQDTGRVMTVPGFFAADGDAANTGASSGDVWRVHFTPPEEGNWTYAVSFVTGEDVAVSLNPGAGVSAGFMDGATGAFEVVPTTADGADLRARGTLIYDGDQFLSFAGDGSVFLKSGVGSPENFLAYSGFDNTPDSHDYAVHEADFRPGDPTWAQGEGQGIIGAVNYLADQGVNSIYFMAMNVGGDGRDAWPWADENLNQIAKNAGEPNRGANQVQLTTEAQSFDVSKLAQWDIVFDHMQEQGVVLHMFLQETENDFLLNDGELGLERMLLLRELVARFGHHNGLIFNLGEENTNTAGQLRDHSAYLQSLDAYDHPIALHTFPGQHGNYANFYGEETLDVLSFQTSSTTGAPNLDRFLGDSTDAGRPYVAFLDEPGNAAVGAAAIGDPGWAQNHDELIETLWRFYTEGGSGAEWYFGYQTQGGQGGDLRLEDFSTRDSLYQAAAAARLFFEQLPLTTMTEADGLTTGTTGGDHVMADPGQIYAVFLPDGGTADLDLTGYAGSFSVRWYDPLTGGAFQDGSVTTVPGGGVANLGIAPSEPNRDWAILVEADGAVIPDPDPAPDPDPTPVPTPGAAPLDVFLAFTDTDATIAPLEDGDAIDLADLEGRPITIFAEPSAGAPAIGSVRLVAPGVNNQTENIVPYALFGDQNGDFRTGAQLEPGDYTVTLTAYAGTNGNGAVLGESTLAFTITDIPPPPVNLPPIVSDATFSIQEDTGFFEFDVLANSLGTDPEGEDIFFDSAVGAQNGDVTLAGEGSILVYTPDPDFFGTETIDVTLSDRTAQGSNQSSATLTVIVEPVNDAPIVPDATFTLPANAQFTEFEIFANDLGADPEGEDIFFDRVEGAQNGEISVAGAGSLFFYTPNPNFVGTETLTVAISDRTAQGTEQTTATVTLVVEAAAPEPPAELLLAFNAGGQAVTSGIAYDADRTAEFATGTTRAFGDGSSLYGSERWGQEFDLDIPLDDGTYEVTLHFAEIYFNEVGRRVFDVAIEDTLVIDDLDIFAEVGAGTPLDRVFTIDVTDGVLNLDFAASVNNAKLAGIVIRTVDEADPSPAPAPTPLASFALHDADTNAFLTELENGAAVPASLVEGRALTIVATPEASLGAVESARFAFGEHTRTENMEPYALFGDRNGDFLNGAALQPGDYVVTVAFYDQDDANGALLGENALNFSISAGGDVLI